MVIGVLGALLVLGLGDYLLRFQDRGVRIIADARLVGVVGWVSHTLSLACDCRCVERRRLARRVERRFPELADRLSSAMRLSRPAGGRTDRGVGGAATSRSSLKPPPRSRPRWSAAVDARPAVAHCTIALAVVLVATVIGLLRSADGWVGFERLAMPWRDVAWPREHSLGVQTAR